MRASALALLLALASVLLVGDWQWDAQAQQFQPLPGKKPIGRTFRCTIDSVSPVNFGTYDGDSRLEQTSTGRLRFTCTPNDRLTVQVTIGPSVVTGSIADRAMRELGGANLLHYNLFQDRRGTILWGDGATGGSPLFVEGKNKFNVEIFGVARPEQEVSEGTYADLLRITILP